MRASKNLVGPGHPTASARHCAEGPALQKKMVGTNLVIVCHLTGRDNLVKSSQNHLTSNTNSVHRGYIRKEVLGIVKGKPQGTNPAVMGIPINYYIKHLSFIKWDMIAY